MLRALSFIPVREQQHEAAYLAPFRLGGGDELIDDDLRAVREIAELRFPKGQGMGVGNAIAVFKTEHAEFAERAIVNLERRLIFIHELQRDVAMAILEIVKGKMPLAERAAAGILTAQTHRHLLENQTAECDRLRESPIHRSVIGERFAPLFHKPVELG